MTCIAKTALEKNSCSSHAALENLLQLGSGLENLLNNIASWVRVIGGNT
jgi:hypothetical protein